MKILNPDDFDIAFRAVEFRKDLDDIIKKHGAELILGWDGKWAKVQVAFKEAAPGKAITIVRTAKGKRMSYVIEEEDIK